LYNLPWILRAQPIDQRPANLLAEQFVESLRTISFLASESSEVNIQYGESRQSR
jgi:hypothetical protein